MKRFLSVFLCAALFCALALPTGALESEEDLRTSSYCVPASMSENRELFSALESEDLHAALTQAAAARFFYELAERRGELTEAASSAAAVETARDSSASAWAAANGLFASEDGGFQPQKTLNRETLCLAMQAYLTAVGAELELINPRYSFLDGEDFSRAGAEAAALMQRSGVLIEGTDGRFSPAAEVTNLEAEQILLRFLGGLRRAFPALPVSTVEESEAVDPSWFDDACFIGHSQVVGMSMYFDLDNADYYAVIGHTAQDVLDYPYYTMTTGRMGTLRRALENAEYGKVYIMLGINDCSNRENRIEEFKEPMRQILQIVRETQPEAVIYLISLAPVGRETRYNAIYNPENTILYSQALKDLSREFSTEYLDLFRLMCDGDGYMLDEFNAGDGIHIRAAMYPVIEDFLRCHTAS